MERSALVVGARFVRRAIMITLLQQREWCVFWSLDMQEQDAGCRVSNMAFRVSYRPLDVRFIPHGDNADALILHSKDTMYFDAVNGRPTPLYASENRGGNGCLVVLRHRTTAKNSDTQKYLKTRRLVSPPFVSASSLISIVPSSTK